MRCFSWRNPATSRILLWVTELTGDETTASISAQKEDENYKEKALELLEHLPSEKNEIINKWKNTGVEIKKAYDSQALLEIYNEFCSKKQCLNCIIGKQLLNRWG